MSTIPRCIEVVRDSTGVAQLVVDGTVFPYAMYAGAPVTVEIAQTSPPTVRLTLVAHSVLVSDELLADADLNEDHHHGAEDASGGEVETYEVMLHGSRDPYKTIEVPQ